MPAKENFFATEHGVKLTTNSDDRGAKKRTDFPVLKAQIHWQKN
jgi:hypothetical protein